MPFEPRKHSLTRSSSVQNYFRNSSTCQSAVEYDGRANRGVVTLFWGSADRLLIGKGCTVTAVCKDASPWLGSHCGRIITRPSLSTCPSPWLARLFPPSDVPMKKFSLSVPEYLEAGDTNWDTWFKGGTGPLNTACFCSKTLCNDA